MTYDLSILVATYEERSPFWSWLAYQIKQQTYLEKHHVEVLVCDDAANEAESAATIELEGMLDHLCDVRHVQSVFFNIAAKRNALQDAAQGRYLAWMDDDDWHAPGWLERSIALLDLDLGTRKFLWTCLRGVTYHNVLTGLSWSPRAWGSVPVPITTVCRNTPDLPTFTSGHSEDVRWFHELTASAFGDPLSCPIPDFVALVHPLNTSSWLHRPRVQAGFWATPMPFSTLDLVELDALKRRLSIEK